MEYKPNNLAEGVLFFSFFDKLEKEVWVWLTSSIFF